MSIPTDRSPLAYVLVRILESGHYWVRGTAVPLRVLVEEFRQGAPPEEVHRALPGLSLAQVYGAIAFYLAHREWVEAKLRCMGRPAPLFPVLSQADPGLYARLAPYRRLLVRLRRQADAGVPRTSDPGEVG